MYDVGIYECIDKMNFFSVCFTRTVYMDNATTFSHRFDVTVRKAAYYAA